jgi:hypothetical protein
MEDAGQARVGTRRRRHVRRPAVPAPRRAAIGPLVGSSPQTLERRPLDDRAQRPRHLGEYGRSAACWGCRSSPRRRRGTRGYWAGCRASARCAWSGSRAPAATVPGWPAIWPRAGRPERGGGRQHRGEQPGQVDAPLRGRRASLSRGVQPGAQARQPVRDSPRPFLSAAVGPRRPVSAGPRSRRFRHHG